MSFRISDLHKYLTFKLIYSLGLVLIAITLPTKWIQLNNICILLTLAVWVIERGIMERLKKVIKDKLFILLSVIYLLYIFSLTYSENLFIGLKQLEARFVIVAFPVLILSYFEINKGLLNSIFAGFLISCLIVSAICLIYTFYENHLMGLSYSFDSSYQYSSFTLTNKWGFHPSYFATYCSFCVFIVIWFFKNRKMNLILAILTIVYLFAFQTLLASRVGVLSLLFVLTVTVLHEAFIHRKLWIGIAGALAFIIISLIGFYSSSTLRIKLFAMINYDVNIYNAPFKFDNRFTMWSSSLTIFKSNFFSGVGLGDQKDELEKLYETSSCELCKLERFDSHNVFLDAAVTLGVAGLLATIGIFFISLRSAIHNKNELHLEFLTLFLLLSLVESTFSVQKGVVFFFFFNTIFLAYNRKKLNYYRLQGR